MDDFVIGAEEYKELLEMAIKCEILESVINFSDYNREKKAYRQWFYEEYPNEVEDYIFSKGCEINDLDIEDFAEILLSMAEEVEV